MSNPTADVVVFRVVGDLRGDPEHLLLTSPDGCWFDYDIVRGTVAPVEPADSWDMDAQHGAEVRMWTPTPGWWLDHSSG